MSPYCDLSSPTSGWPARLICGMNEATGLLPLTATPQSSTTVCNRCTWFIAVSSVVIFATPAPSSLGPAMAKRRIEAEGNNGQFTPASLRSFDSRVRPELAANPEAQRSIELNYGRCEAGPPHEERGPDPVGIDRYAFLFKLSNPVERDPARRQELHVAESLSVQRVPHVPDELGPDAGRREGSHHRDDRRVDQVLGGGQLHAPEASFERAGEVQRRAYGVVVIVDRHDDLHVLRRAGRGR